MDLASTHHPFSLRVSSDSHTLLLLSVSVIFIVHPLPPPLQPFSKEDPACGGHPLSNLVSAQLPNGHKAERTHIPRVTDLRSSP